MVLRRDTVDGVNAELITFDLFLNFTQSVADIYKALQRGEQLMEREE